MAQTGGPNAARGLPTRVVNRKPPRRVPVKRSPVFGPIGRADAPIVRAQRQTRRAQAPILKRVNVPYVPKLAHPTPSQRSASKNIVGQGLRSQGVTTRDVKALSRGQGSRQQQVAINRYLGAIKTEARKLQAGVGRAAPVQGLAEGITRNLIQALPGAEPPMSFVDPLVRGAQLHQRLVPSAERQYAQVGRQVALGNRAQGTPYAHQRAGFGPATIDLTAAQQALAPAVAKAGAFPLAIVKATFGAGGILDNARVFSDKGVLGRTLNDLITYPAAAVPAAYNTVMHPEQTAGAIVDQVTHPVQTFKEHPLFGALLLHGGVSALGRTGGAIARSGVLGEDIARAGSTVRAPLTLGGSQGTRLLHERHYSKSLIHKGAQVLSDRRLTGAKYADDRPITVTRGGKRVQVQRPAKFAAFNSRGRLIRKRGDFLASRPNAAERLAREQESKAAMGVAPAQGKFGVMRPSQPAGRMRVLRKSFYRPERDVVTHAMQGVLRSPETFREDLIKERQRLEDAYKSKDLAPDEKYTNRANARTIDRVLKDPRAMSNTKEVFAAAKALAGRSGKLADEAVAAKILDPAAAERAKLFPYAQAHMGAKATEHTDGTVSLRGGDGSFLSNDQIRAHMRANGVNPDEVGFITHRADLRGARAFHVQFRPGRRQNLDTYHRTGSTFEKGAVASDYGAAVEHLVRTRNVLTNVHETDRLINEAGIRHPDGRDFTWDEAVAYSKRAGRAGNEATNRMLPGEPELIPIRAHPAKYDQARQAEIRDVLQNPSLPGEAEKLMEQGFLERLKRPDAETSAKAQNVVLIPADLKARLEQHLESTKSAERGIQAATSAFRTTVLPFSVKWLTGNVAEALGRLAVAGVTPHDSRVGRKIINEMIAMDAQAGHAFKSTAVGGLLYGERGLTNRRTLQDITRTGGSLARLPVVRELSSTLGAYTKGVFAFNRLLEQESQYAALGKYARRQMQEMGHSWLNSLRAQNQAVKDAAKGLRDTSAQHDAARFIDETLGQYSRFSPFVRHLVQTYTPFLPWYLNSVRFVFWTLPAHHPVKTALLTQAEAAFQKDYQDQHKAAPPGSLKTAIPSKGGFVDLARYTPFGFPGPVFAGETSMIPSPLLPQVSGAVHAFEGQDPFGKPLKTPKTPSNPQGTATPGQNVEVALNQLAQGFLPLLGLGQRIREKGGKPYSTSTIFNPQTQPLKPGAKKISAADRILNPIRPVYVSGSRAGGGQLSPAQRAVLKAYQSSPAAKSSTSSGLTPAQEAVLRAYKLTHK